VSRAETGERGEPARSDLTRLLVEVEEVDGISIASGRGLFDDDEEVVIAMDDDEEEEEDASALSESFAADLFNTGGEGVNLGSGGDSAIGSG
jgi:hypothetical protein